MPERDFLDKMIDKRTAGNPEFPRLLDAARQPGEPYERLSSERTGAPAPAAVARPAVTDPVGAPIR